MRYVVGPIVGMLIIFSSMAAVADDRLLSDPVAQLEDSLSGGFFKRVDISGVVEVEAGYTSDYEDAKQSDVDLTNFELGLDVGLTDFAGGFVLLKWEEDGDEGVFVDEGGIVLGNLEEYGFSVTAGKLYVPFGVYETGMISDPLTLELGETREGAVTVDFAQGGFYGAVYAFNSAVGDDEEDDMIDAFGVTAGYVLETEMVNADFSVGYISNMLSSGGFTDALDEAGIEILDDYSAGMTASAVVTVADWTLIGEYLMALDNDYLAATEDEPSAWNLEIGYAFELDGHQSGVSLAYQGTDEAVFLGLPETRYMASVNYELTAGVGIAFEVAHDEDYDEQDGGTDESADSVLCQLAIEF